jgi:hypothetical protein
LQGQLEERLPLMGLSLPARFHHTAYYEALQLNSHVLTTPFDLHATLHDILDWPTEQMV